MNEKLIRKLAFDSYSGKHHTFDEILFTKLIINECVKIVDDCMIEAATSLPENYLGESLLISMKITDVAWKIKKHFGVK